MGYAQWVNISIHNKGSRDIKIQNLVVSWGKLYQGPGTSNMDEEISPTKYEGWIIKPDETATIHACGREASPSGTTGEFNLIDTMGGHTIRHFYWDCPWGSSGNVWRLSERNPQWMVDSEGENLGEGPLGVISVNVFNIN